MENVQVDYQVNGKENVYFYIRLFVSLGLYYLLYKLIWLSFQQTDVNKMAMVYGLYFYIVLIVLALFFRFGILLGHLRGNAIKLSKTQLPDIHQVVVRQCGMLGLTSVPSVFIMQSGGVLNAFAARFLGRNYIVLYSEIVEAAYEQDKAMLEFIIAHELGHIRRNHMLKNLLLFPSWLIPFLAAAYSRACEYTCDNIAYALCPEGAKSGLLTLASGKSIYRKVNLNEFTRQDATENGFWKWLAEKVSSHPNLTKRLKAFKFEAEKPSFVKRPPLSQEPVAQVQEQPVESHAEEDHSRFMPH